MAITAKVDNPERYAIQRGRHIFLPGSKGVEFNGPRSDFLQVKACSYLNVYDVEDDTEAASTSGSVVENDQSKADVKNDQTDAKVQNDQSTGGKRGRKNAKSS